MALKSDAKFEEKLTCGLENDRRNFANFHQNTQNSRNWDFDVILLSKVQAVRSKGGVGGGGGRWVVSSPLKIFVDVPFFSKSP